VGGWLRRQADRHEISVSPSWCGVLVLAVVVFLAAHLVVQAAWTQPYS
jgi:hypothetical protein